MKDAHEFVNRRRLMVEQLRSSRIREAAVLKAMASIPREEFVLPTMREHAYDDTPLPIGLGQTISQPFTVAYMCQAAQIVDTDKVLEIGTGSGYGAAVLSRLAAEVFTVERIPELAQQAKSRLHRLAYGNVHVHCANGTLGLKEFAPFDAIIITAGSDGLPIDYLEQLADGGRIVIPIGNRSYGQTMYRFTRHHGRLMIEDLGPFAFVPLIGQHGWSPTN